MFLFQNMHVWTCTRTMYISTDNHSYHDSIWEGLNSSCEKVALARCDNNKIQSINVLQNVTLDAIST